MVKYSVGQVEEKNMRKGKPVKKEEVVNVNIYNSKSVHWIKRYSDIYIEVS